MDTSTQVAQIIVVWTIMTLVAGVTVGLRFYTRRYILTVLGTEDWLILVAMILSVGTCIGFIRQTIFALGHHIWTRTPEQMVQWGKEQWYTFLFYTMSLAFTKLSILVLYTRILVHGPLRIANLVVLAIVTACNIWVFISICIQCIPLQAVWDPTVKGWCLGLAGALGNSILHIVTDFMIFVLPLPALINLKIHRKQKIGLIVIFCLGFVYAILQLLTSIGLTFSRVCFFSIIRITVIRSLDFSDVTYSFSTVALLGAVEINLAIICACLTTLKPLVARFFPRLLGSAFASSYSAAIKTIPSRREVMATSTVHSKRASVILEQHCFSKLEDADKTPEVYTSDLAFELERQTHQGSYLVPEPSKAYDQLGLAR
ncbi:hypothetical protein OQA88_10726 [Cercophora sp. LCS_1]